MRIMGSVLAGVLVGAALKIGGAGWVVAGLVGAVCFGGVYALTAGAKYGPGKLPVGSVTMGEPVLQTGDAQEP